MTDAIPAAGRRLLGEVVLPIGTVGVLVALVALEGSLTALVLGTLVFLGAYVGGRHDGHTDE